MFRLHCSPALVEPPDAASLRHLTEVAQRTLDHHKPGGVVDIVLTDDTEVRRLNGSFRGRDVTTDVLSFSFVEDGQQSVATPQELPIEDIAAGEVYISVPQATAQAVQLGISPPEELARLLVHGLLHLAGYDHQTEAELQVMEQLTEDLLKVPGSPEHDPSWRTDSPKGV